MTSSGDTLLSLTDCEENFTSLLFFLWFSVKMHAIVVANFKTYQELFLYFSLVFLYLPFGGELLSFWIKVFITAMMSPIDLWTIILNP